MYQDVVYHFLIECTIYRIYRELLLTFSYIVFSLNKVKDVVNMCICNRVGSMHLLTPGGEVVSPLVFIGTFQLHVNLYESD